MSGYLNRFLGGKGVGNDQVDHIYTSVFMGFAARLSSPQLERLSNDPRVKSIEPDQTIALGKPVKVTPVVETVPWGIARVNGGVSGAKGTAWVIDSGIDLDHPDLNVDDARSKSFLTTTASPDDQNGHGTHVAGTIAAIDNSIGVIGVAAGATVVAVRVLDRRGSGTTTGVIAGCDYVAANANLADDVANMSLGGGVSTALDAAVLAMSQKVRVALAAGNESDDAINHSPARVEGTNVYTVSAMGSGDLWASFSNYGAVVDYCAPGVSIYSCYKGGGYATLSGTSMAAPHMAGILLLGAFKTDGNVIGDPDGNADLIAVH
jgi:subtilisin family serine protease